MGRGLQRWYTDHMHDYDAVEDRLTACRNVMLRGRMDAAADMLEKATVYAVFSIQTQLDRHERAFTMHYAGDRSLRSCALETNYGPSKADWLQHSLATFDFEGTVSILRESGPTDALGSIEAHFKGLSWTKGAFALALCGITSLACPDSHTKNYIGYDERIRTREDYEVVLKMIDNSISVDTSLFLKQYAMFDYERGEHARHSAWFAEALPSR